MNNEKLKPVSFQFLSAVAFCLQNSWKKMVCP